MNRNACFIISILFLLISCATQQVSYRNDVAPILQSRCVQCHTAPDGSGYRATGLELGSYDALMQGTVYGPVIIVGDSRRSILNMLVEGRAGKSQSMPHQEGDVLTEHELKLLSEWVNQGAHDN
ncbi:MAG: hypothetical protein WBO73_02910 [Gammaproteobacteria bacterium]|jgi:uncharacterized membrane protein